MGWWIFGKKAEPRSRYGWHKDLTDTRDLLYTSVMPMMVALPPKVDLREFCSPVENQGDLGSCTGQAIAGHLELLQNKNKKTFMDMSRLFIYYNERALEGTTSYDSGAFLRDGIKSLNKLGCCAEAEWPYAIDKFTAKPPKNCYRDALKNRISSYYRMQTRNELLSCLAQGYPFVCGITVYESFESLDVTHTGIVPIPKSTEKVLGGHAVLAVGYDQDAQTFLVRNSWGPTWGMAGYFTLPYTYVDTLASDFWTIRR